MNEYTSGLAAGIMIGAVMMGIPCLLCWYGWKKALEGWGKTLASWKQGEQESRDLVKSLTVEEPSE